MRGSLRALIPTRLPVHLFTTPGHLHRSYRLYLQRPKLWRLARMAASAEKINLDREAFTHVLELMSLRLPKKDVHSLTKAFQGYDLEVKSPLEQLILPSISDPAELSCKMCLGTAGFSWIGPKCAQSSGTRTTQTPDCCYSKRTSRVQVSGKLRAVWCVNCKA